MCVCWFVCLLFIGHTTFVHFAALPPSVRESRSRRGRPRAPRGQAHALARARARMPYNFSTKKIAALMPFKNKTVRARWSEPTLVSSSIPIKEQCLFVGLSAFYRPHEISYFAALPPSPRAGAVAGGPARAGKHAQRSSESTRAHAVLTSQLKNRSADAFQKQNRTRAHAVVYVTAEIFKKREKENQHATSQVQFTVCLLLECLLFESY